MSLGIERQVVQMVLDNDSFINGAIATTQALTQLKASMNFEKAASESAKSVGALNNISFENLAASIDALQNRFSVFGIASMEVVKRLTNSIIDMGLNLANSVKSTIITKGTKRAFNIENAHFMLQGLIDDEKEVKAIMDQANESVDGTAYGYDQAASAAGQFAASGVQAGDDMKKALRAITGVAATTNSEYEDISRIFTTVAGNGRLMSDQLNQLSSRGLNAAATLGKVMGKTEAEVREMTSKGQIDFMTFASAMDEAFGEHAKKANETFNGALSNMKSALGRIGADWIAPFIEQNSTLVGLINTFRVKINDVRAAITRPLAESFLPKFIMGEEGFIKKFDDMIKKIDIKSFNTSDWVLGFQQIGFAMRWVGLIVSEFSNRFKDAMSRVDDIFGNTGDKIRSFRTIATEIQKFFASVFRYLRDNFDDQNNPFNSLIRILMGVKSAFLLVKNIAVSFAKVFGGPIFSAIGSILSVILDKLGEFSIRFTEFTGNLVKSNKIEEYFRYALDAIQDFITVAGMVLADIRKKLQPLIDFLKPVYEAIAGFFKSLAEHFGMKFKENYFSDVSNSMDEVTQKFKPFTAAWNALKSVVEKVFGFMGKLFDKAKPMFVQLGKTIGTFLGDAVQPLLKALKGQGWDTFFELMNGGMMYGMFASIAAIASNLSRVIKGFDFKAIAKNSGFAKFMSNVTQTLGRLKDVLLEYQMALKVGMIKSIAQAIVMLTAAIFVLSTIDPADAQRGIGFIALIMGELVAAFAAMQGVLEFFNRRKTSNPFSALIGAFQDLIQFAAMGLIMKNLATSIILISVALAMLSEIDEDGIKQGLMALTVIMAELTVFCYFMAQAGKDIRVRGPFFIGLAIGIFGMAVTLKMLAKMDWDSIARGVSAMMGIVVGIMGILTAMGNMEHDSWNVGKGLSIVLIAASMVILAQALKQLSGIQNVGDNVVALSGAMIAIGAFLLIMGKLDLVDIVTAAGAMEVAVESISTLSDGLKKLSEIKNIEQAMLAMTAGIIVMAVAMTYLSNAKVLSGAVAMIICAAAISTLASPLGILGGLNILVIVVALMALAGVFLVFGAASKVLAKTAPAMFEVASALFVLGGSLAVFATAALEFAMALTMIAAVGSAGSKAIAQVLETLVTIRIKALQALYTARIEIVAALVGIISEFVVQIGPVLEQAIHILGEILEEFCLELQTKAPVVVDTIIALWEEANRALDKILPEFFGHTLPNLISSALDMLRDHSEEWTEKLCDILINVINGVSNRADEITNAVGNLMVNFLNSISNWIDTHLEEVKAAAWNIVGSLLYFVASFLEDVWNSAGDLGTVFLDAIKDFFDINSPSVVMEDVGYNIVQGLIGGLHKGIDLIKTAAEETIYALSPLYDAFHDDAGAKDHLGKIGDAAWEAINRAKLNRRDLAEQKQMYKELDEAREAYADGFTELDSHAGYYLQQMRHNGGGTDVAYHTSSNGEVHGGSGGKFGPEGGSSGSSVAFGTISEQKQREKEIEAALEEENKTIAEYGERHMQTYAEYVASQSGTVQEAGNAIGNSVNDGISSNTGAIEKTAEKHVWSYADTMKAHVAESKAAGSSVGKSSAQGISDSGSSISSIGGVNVNKYASAFASKHGLDITSLAGVKVGTSSADGAKSVTPEMVKTGHAYDDGLIRGVTDPGYLNRLYEAGYTAGDKLDEGTRDALEVRSPSRKARQVGRYYNEGLIQGLKDTRGLIEASTVVTSTMMSVISGAINDVNEMTDQLNVTPTITPVLDMNHVDTGMLSSMLSANRTMRMSGDLKVDDNRSQSALLNALNNLEKNGNRDVVSALNILSGNVAQYTDAVRGMRIVMDSGTLVGEIGEAMDYRLGSINNYRQRGMM